MQTPNGCIQRKQNAAANMLFTARLVIASLAIMSVSGLDNSPPSHEMPLVRQPGIPSRFRIYDPPVDVLHAVGGQRGGSMGIEHKIRIALT